MNNKVYDVLIIEDEYPARMLMMDYIMNCPELKLTGIAETGEKALEILSQKSFDLVFLDINLPQITGLEILKQKQDLNSHFVLTTAYSEFAVEAFEWNAIDYLLKPFSFDRFRKAVDKSLKAREEKAAMETNSTITNKALKIQIDSAMHLIPWEDIHFISAHNKSVVIHTKEKDFESVKLLKDIEEKLPKQKFLRIHKGFIVNLNYVGSLKYEKGGAYTVQLKNEDETSLPVGRAYAQALKDTLNL